eukprot:364905-Chlamydomonas_euryale.AAC.22
MAAFVYIHNATPRSPLHHTLHTQTYTAPLARNRCQTLAICQTLSVRRKRSVRLTLSIRLTLFVGSVHFVRLTLPYAGEHKQLQARAAFARQSSNVVARRELLIGEGTHPAVLAHGITAPALLASGSTTPELACKLLGCTAARSASEPGLYNPGAPCTRRYNCSA